MSFGNEDNKLTLVSNILLYIQFFLTQYVQNDRDKTHLNI